LVPGLLLLLALGVVPDSAVHPSTFSVVGLADTHAVDFEDGIVWFLLLGSDAREGEDVMDGRADAIELVGLDFDTGHAAAVAVPRDTWIDVPGHGPHRINATLALEGPSGVADEVEALVGIAPDYVLTTGFEGFETMVDSIGPVPVVSRFSFQPPGSPVAVRRGLNRMDGAEALAFARARVPLPRSDFDRIANQHSLMKGILRSLRGGADTEGFIERGSLAALRGFDTNLSPVDLYRLAQAVTTFHVSQVTTCAIIGTEATETGAAVLHVDPGRARGGGGDVQNDARIDEGCG
jgi:LCP family protein required for cell wall assembly